MTQQKRSDSKIDQIVSEYKKVNLDLNQATGLLAEQLGLTILWQLVIVHLFSWSGYPFLQE